MRKSKFIEWLYRELPGLVKQGVLPEEIALKIKNHYGEINLRSKMQIAFAIFGVIGAVCIGLGVILLFAHNWDALSRIERTVLAFAPLVISMLLLGWAIVKEKTSPAIREGFSVFNMISIGATISLIGQIYNLPGDIDRFMLIWMLLSIPLVYIMRANFCSLLYLVGITIWAGTAQTSGGHALLFWPLAGLIFPHYLKKFNDDAYSSVSVWLSSAICLCFTVAIGISLEKVLPGLWIIVYSAYFSALYLIGKSWFDDAVSVWQKPFRNFGIIGTTILSYIFTYEWVWEDIGWRYYRVGGKFHEVVGFFDYIVAIVLFVSAVVFIVKAAGEKRHFELSFGFMPILAILCYSFSGFGGNVFIAIWIFNLYVLFLGIICVMTGIREKLLGITNIGILILGIIILTRFLDASLGIIERAVVFIFIGTCFVAANVVLSKKIQSEVQS